MTATDVAIVPLDTARWPDLASLFHEGGDPKSCWCTFWRFRATDWSRMSVDERCDTLRSAGADSAHPPGLVAVRANQVIGWISVAPREDFRRLVHSRFIPLLPGERVWSVVCFVIGRAARGQRLSERLLAAATEHVRQHGGAIVEAYPVAAAGGRVAPAAAYTGIESVFITAGFSRVAETTSTAGGLARVVVRRQLTADPA